VGIALAFAGGPGDQSTREETLIVNGKTASTAARQIDGRPYVDIQALAEAANDTVTIEPNRSPMIAKWAHIHARFHFNGYLSARNITFSDTQKRRATVIVPRTMIQTLSRDAASSGGASSSPCARLAEV
jgi:hypothetical protein